jgi:hypothetical protein
MGYYTKVDRIVLKLAFRHARHPSGVQRRNLIGLLEDFEVLQRVEVVTVFVLVNFPTYKSTEFPVPMSRSLGGRAISNPPAPIQLE